MTTQDSWSDRRQFGRRTINLEAAAVVADGSEVVCIIENLSDGGALLSFPSGLAPVQSFRLAVGGFDYRLACEIRHSRGGKLGIMFESLAQGAQLNRFLAKPQDLNQPKDWPALEPLAQPPQQAASVRQLRRAMLQSPPDIATVAASRPPRIVARSGQ